LVLEAVDAFACFELVLARGGFKEQRFISFEGVTKSGQGGQGVKCKGTGS